MIGTMSEPVHHSVEVDVAAGDVDVVVDQIWLCEPMAVGELETAHGVRYTVGFADRHSADRAMARLAAWRPTLHTAAADDWVSTWRQGATPMLAGPFRVRLPEHEPIDDCTDVEIEPGVTFGFGHPSTLLALELLARADIVGTHVLDVGSGSGILGVAAALLGAATVVAVDVDAAAVAATTDNARRNRVAVDARLGSVGVTAAEPVDVIVANLTAGTQAAVLPELGPRLAPHTSTIVSGLLDGQETTVASLLPRRAIVDEARLDGWIAVRLALPSAASPSP